MKPAGENDNILLSGFHFSDQKHYPQVLKYMSTTVSPMTATGRLIKAMHPDAVCVFIGPCSAKKSEVVDSITFGGADYAMTYEELASMFEAKNIDPEECAEPWQGSKFGKQYSVSGGVTAGRRQKHSRKPTKKLI